jgi:hypothetical protein
VGFPASVVVGPSWQPAGEDVGAAEELAPVKRLTSFVMSFR